MGLRVEAASVGADLRSDALASQGAAPQEPSCALLAPFSVQ
jgi:hypothetical protein